MMTSDEELGHVVQQEPTCQRRMKLRVGVVVAAVALLGAVVKVTQWSSNNGTTQPASKTADQQNQPQTVAKFVDPCAPAPTAAPLCAAFNGTYFAASQSCCASACGTFCGAVDCQRAPVGYQNCCTGKFTNLCGSPGVVAPCNLPKTIAGVVQLLLNNGAIASDPAAVAAVQAALAKLLGVPVSAITAKLAASGGRRLSVEAVNVDYDCRVPRDSPLTAAAIVTKSPQLKTILQGELIAAGVNVTVQEVELPTPAVQEAGAAESTVSTSPVPLLSTTTTPPTNCFMGLITFATNASDVVLDSAASREALKAALAEVLGINATAVTVLGESDGTGNNTKAGYTVCVPTSVTGQTITDSAAALVMALQNQFNLRGIAATVFSCTFGTPQQQVSTTSVAPEASTVAPVAATTVAPVAATTVAPVAATTVAPVASTTVAPVAATTVAPGATTTAAPVASTTVAPVATTTTAAPTTTAGSTPAATTTTAAPTTTAESTTAATTTTAAPTTTAESTTAAITTTAAPTTTAETTDDDNTTTAEQ